MVDINKNQREAEEIKFFQNHYLDKRKKIMNSTQFRVEDNFGDIIGKDNVTHGQIGKRNCSFSNCCR